MTGIDSSELLLLLVIGLIVLGPKRLPEIANTFGSWIGQARRMTRVMRRQLEEELSLDEPHRIVPPASTPLASADPADTGTDVDDEAEVAPGPVPGDNDTFSPLHDDAAESGDVEEDVTRDGKST